MIFSIPSAEEASSAVKIPSPLRLANRMQRLGTETAFEVLARARALEAKGRSIVHLEIGEPDFETPDNIVKAGAWDTASCGPTWQPT